MIREWNETKGWITARLSATTFAALARTIAAAAAGLVQAAVLFPLEKYVLLKKEYRMEKVSVIVPVYNGEKYIKRCADSILSQDYPELELIMVDDGSRDRSWEIMQAIAAADHRVKAIHQENGGVSSARNRALDLHATGPSTKQAGPMYSLRMWMTGCRWTPRSCWCGRWKHNHQSLQ